MNDFDDRERYYFIVFNCVLCSTPILMDCHIEYVHETSRNVYVFVFEDNCINIMNDGDIVRCDGCRHVLGRLLAVADPFDPRIFENIIRFNDEGLMTDLESGDGWRGRRPPSSSSSSSSSISSLSSLSSLASSTSGVCSMSYQSTSDPEPDH